MTNKHEQRGGLTYQDRLDIREFYMVRDDRIRRTFGWGFGHEQEEYVWADRMSPIEREVWMKTITSGLVMYPEYPVGPYWIDFGNPRTKVGIECDGAAFHADRRKDDAREARLRDDFGWVIYRITGAETLKPVEWWPSGDDDEEYERWIQGDGLEQFIARIRDKHGNGEPISKCRWCFKPLPGVRTICDDCDEYLAFERRHAEFREALDKWKEIT